LIKKINSGIIEKRIKKKGIDEIINFLILNLFIFIIIRNKDKKIKIKKFSLEPAATITPKEIKLCFVIEIFFIDLICENTKIIIDTPRVQ
jgi:large-conductance mechanosensitive channel